MIDEVPGTRLRMDPRFNRGIRSNPSAWDILIDILLDDLNRGEKARGALVWVDDDVLQLLGSRVVKTPDADGRVTLLHLIWVILRTMELERRHSKILEVLEAIDSVLDDKRIHEPKVSPSVEIEYLYRVCDQTYVVFRSLLTPEFDEAEFRWAEDRERDLMIQEFRSAPATLT